MKEKKKLETKTRLYWNWQSNNRNVKMAMLIICLSTGTLWSASSLLVKNRQVCAWACNIDRGEILYDFFYDLPNRIISKEFDNQLQLFEGLILIFCGTHSTAGIKKTETKMQRVIHLRMSKWYLWVSFLSDPSPILVWDVPNWLTDWFMLLTLE